VEESGVVHDGCGDGDEEEEDAADEEEGYSDPVAMAVSDSALL